MCACEEALPTDFDVVVVGTGLTESMVCSSLSVTGSTVLHIDRHNFYGSFMTTVRFNDMLKLDEYWFPTDQINELTADQGFNLAVLNKSLLKNFSSTFCFSNSNVEVVDEIFRGNGVLSPQQAARKWTKNDLIRDLKSTDFDLLPRAIFAESPIVNSLIRSSVCRYLEFLPINRLLFFNPNGIDDRVFASTDSKTSRVNSHQHPAVPSLLSSLLVKVPVSRGDVFRTRILSLSQKRMLVSFFEWCVTYEQDPSSHVDIEESDYLDRPLMDYLQEKRGLDVFVSRIVTNCLAFSEGSITLKDALPRFRRLVSSMNRVSPFPLLWPRFGCGELPQSFCRMCAVFSGIYCLGRTLTAVYPNTTNGRRRYRVRLSTGEEVSTSCILIGAEQAPTEWVFSQISRWIARAILVTTGSIYPNGHNSNDITLMPLQLSAQCRNFNEPAFLLETPADNRNENTCLYLVHLTAVCDTCVDASELFTNLIDQLYPTVFSNLDCLGVGDAEFLKPQILWKCFFTIPDLSDVPSHGLARAFNLEDEGFIVAPGPDSSIFIDKCVHSAKTIFNELFNLIHGCKKKQHEASNQIEPRDILSLEQHWDGIFPPRPPKPEDLVFTVEDEVSPADHEDCVVADTMDDVESAPQ
ncbi:unnamed protein product [Rodentolepis nana]|uniref:Rab proteins geranylgeranyltransferase component A n=1 Tax=Rodentolepis nana TaxID=102285 RepID=A0A0R3TK62_RODNA|nr:unnamed protein product [Rodentolepis nana]